MIFIDMPLMRDDLAFIKKQMKNMPRADIHYLIRKYEVDYMQAYEREPVQHKKENAGLRCANSNLREAVKMLKENPERQNHEPYRCCDNCWFIGKDNVCDKFKQQVPDEYLIKITECEHWIDGIPF
jgi:hypothetical protein